MARQLSSDEEANLKRQLRRRLIGAVALTTAAVIILPMVLDREPAPTAQDIELRIPDKDHAGEFTPRVAVDAASAVSASQSASAPAIAPLMDTQPASAKPAEPARAKQPAQHPATEPKPATPAKPAAKPAEKPAEKTTAIPHSGFAVQVGAFGNAESARHLKDQLNKQGYHAYTEKSGNNIRVRVGSYPTHDAADKVRRKLEAKGLHPNVVNLN